MPPDSPPAQERPTGPSSRNQSQGHSLGTTTRLFKQLRPVRRTIGGWQFTALNPEQLLEQAQGLN